MFITIKKQLLFLFVIIIGSLYFILEFSSPGVEYREIQPATKTFSPKAGIEMKKGRQEYFFRMLRDPATGKIPEAIRERELAFAKELNEKASLLNKPSKIENITWKEAGPVDVGGRTRALAVDVKNPNTILAGGAGGGIWKSTDNGNRWELKSQASEISGITSIAQDTREGHTNTWYYSTGEYRGSGDDQGRRAFVYGEGIYKSIDNGESWKLLPSTAAANKVSWSSFFAYTSKIIIHPLTGDVYTACNGIGIMKSSDGGNNFTLSLGGVNEHEYSDIAVTSNGTLIAAISSTNPQYGETPKNTPGIYKSNDGVNWTNITPSNFPQSHLRTVFGVSAANPNMVYTFTFTGNVNNQNQREEVKFYKINISNGSFEDRSQNIPDFGGDGYVNTQYNYNMVVAVKPDDENFVMIGSTNLFRSTNGFATKPSDAKNEWIGGYHPVTFNYPNFHSDVHSFAFDPTNPNKMWWGNDGGLYYTTDIRNNSYAQFFPWEDKNNSYNVTQFYHLSVPDEPNDTRIMGGTQDNGTPYFRFNGNSATPSTDVSSGDGSYSYFGKDFAYVSVYNGIVIRKHYDQNDNISGEYYSEISPLGAANQLFINPFSIDPNNEDVMYYPAGNVLWRNTQLSQIPENSNKTSVGWTKLDNHTVPSGYLISAVQISKSNPEHTLYYCASSLEAAPKLYKLTNAASSTANPQELVITGAPSGAYVHNIAVNPDDGNEIIVTLSNYNVKSLYHSINGGQSFTPIEGNLDGTEDNPGPSVRSVSILPSNGGNLYFAATSIGLFSTAQLNGSNTVWTQTAGDLIGNTVTEYVTGRKSDGKVFVGTHGRGAFVGETDGTAGTAVATLNVNQLNINVKPDATANANFTIQNTGTANLNYSITASGGSSKPVIDNKIEKLIISSETESKNFYTNGIKSERAVNNENSITKLMNIDSEDILYNDDGDNNVDIFLGYGNYTGFMWMNKFDLPDYGFDLQKIRVYMRSEDSFTNGFAYTIYNQNEEYVALGYAEAANSKEGQWFEATLDQTYSFSAGESFYIQIDAYNLAYNPAAYDMNATVKNNAFYFPFASLTPKNMNEESGYENGAYLIRAVGSKSSGSGNKPPIASGSVSKPSAAVGEQITFDASNSRDDDGQIVNYLWEFGDGQSSPQKIATHSYAAAGTYNIKLTVTDDKGATGTAPGSITITGGGGGNEPPTAVATVSTNQATVGENISFSASQSYDNDGQIVGVLWNFGDGTQSGDVNVNHSYSSEGTYNYVLMVMDDKQATGQTTGQITVTGSGGTERFVVNPSNGSLAPGQTASISVQYNSTGLAEGNYSGQLFVNSNGGNRTIPVSIFVSQTVDVENENNLPSEFVLQQNYPNPFNPKTTIEFSLPQQTKVSLKIYDFLGKEISTLVDKELSAGNHKIDFAAGNLASGVYFYRIEADNFVETKKLVLMK